MTITKEELSYMNQYIHTEFYLLEATIGRIDEPRCVGNNIEMLSKLCLLKYIGSKIKEDLERIEINDNK